MKKFTIFLISLALFACFGSPYLWKTQVRSGFHYDADFHKTISNTHYVTSVSRNHIRLHELNSEGNITLLHEIPADVRPGYRALRINWVEDNFFIITNINNNVFFGNVTEGLNFSYSIPDQFDELEADATVKADSKLLDNGDILIFGDAHNTDSDGDNYFTIRHSADGTIIHTQLVPGFNRPKFLGTNDEGIVIRNYEEVESGILPQLIHLAWDGTILSSHTFPYNHHLRFSVENTLIATVSTQNQALGYDLSGNLLWETDPATRAFRALLTNDGKIALEHFEDGLVEIRSITGEVEESYTTERYTGSFINVVNSDGSHIHYAENYKVKFGAATFDSSFDVTTFEFKTEGIAEAFSEYKLQVNDGKGNFRYYTEKPLVDVQRVENCLVGCSSQHLEYKAGTCEIFDYAIVEGLGLLTASAHCGEDGEQDGLVITRY